MRRAVLLVCVAACVVGCSAGDDGDIVREIDNSPCVYVEITPKRVGRTDDNKRRHPDGIYCLKSMEQ